MVSVKGSSGKSVNVQILGIGGVVGMLRSKGQDITRGADLGVAKAGAYIVDEVKESIIGNRAEHKSVDTGTFANSIEFKKTGEAQGVVEPALKIYPGGQTTKEIALLMEYSKSISAGPRRHFGNTKIRNQETVKDIIKKEIKSII